MASYTASIADGNLIQSNDFETAPTTVDYFHSIGTEALGTLAAWTNTGPWTISSNVVSCPASQASSANLIAGHTDWGDMTWWVRFKWNTGDSWSFMPHYVDLNNRLQMTVDGANINSYKIVAGVVTGLTAATPCVLTAGNWYWFKMAAAGTNYTVTVYNDTGPGSVGTQVATTGAMSATDAAVQYGKICIYTGSNNVQQFGGAFANVCYVTGPAPTGWTTHANSWSSDKEPSYCWSNKQAYSGTHSLSITIPIAGGFSSWTGPTYSIVVNQPVQASCYVLTQGTAQSTITLAGLTSSTTYTGGWGVQSVNFNPGAGGSTYVILGSNLSPTGTLYYDFMSLTNLTNDSIARTATLSRNAAEAQLNGGFELYGSAPNTMVTNTLFADDFEGAAVNPTLLDSRTIVQSNDFETAPSTVDYGHSIGTETLGTLAAWTTRNGTPSISANIADCATVTQSAMTSGWLSDWTDYTWTCRFQANGNNWFGIRNSGDWLNSGYFMQFNVFSGFVLVKCTGTGSTSTTTLATMATGTIVNGTYYWFKLQGNGTTISASYYADSAGAIGAQIGTTATVTDSQWTGGLIEVYNSKVGGAFANVCVVSGPAPTGLTTNPASGSWATAKEPCFCWSNRQAYSGSRSLAIYFPIASSPASSWQPPAVSLASGTAYQTNAYVKIGTGTASANQADSAGTQWTGGSVTGAAWTASSAAYTPGSTASRTMALSASNTTAGATAYFDYETIIQPAVPSGVLFRSLGTDATGTLNAWTQDSGVWAIAANAVTAPNTAARLMHSGHTDWADGTIYVRFQTTANAQPTILLHGSGGMTGNVPSNGVGLQTDSNRNVYLNKYVGGVETTLVTPAIQLTDGSWYWLKLTASGTTYTMSIFNDAAGFVGDQVGSTASGTATDSAVASGVLYVSTRGGTASFLVGGAYSNVCIVQGQLPTGWTSTAQFAGESALCWSKASPYYGTYSLSVYNNDSSADLLVQNAFGSLSSGVAVQIGAAVKQVSGAGTAKIYGNGMTGGAHNCAATSTWNSFSFSDTTSGGSNGYNIRASGAGLFYFDNASITSGYSTAPNNVMFRSLGSDSLGTLAAWTATNSVISANVVTSTGTIFGGHQDWTDATVTARIISGSIGVYLHYVDANNHIRMFYNGGELDLFKVVAGTSTKVAFAFTGTSFGSGSGAYWAVLRISGSTVTATMYNDLNGYLGTTSLATASSTFAFTGADAAIASGKTGVQGINAGGQQWGGAFPNVFIVQTPMPQNWSTVTNAGEPAFAWTSLNPYQGAYGASIYIAESAGDGRWQVPIIKSSIPSNTYTLSTQAKVSAATLNAAFVENHDGGTSSPTFTPTTSWANYTASITPSSYLTNLQLKASYGTGTGTAYFDNFSITGNGSLFNVTDTASRVWSGIRSMSESLSVAVDTLQRNSFNFVKAISESIPSISDAVSRTWTAVRTMTENMSISDTVVRGIAAWNRSISEALPTLTDMAGRVGTFARKMSDSLGAIKDSVFRIPYFVGLRSATGVPLQMQARSLNFKVVTRSVSQIDIQPSTVDVSTYQESLPLNIDCTNYLASGDTVTLPVAILKLASTGYDISSIAIPNAAGISGNIIQITLDATKLQVGQYYTLQVSFTANTNKKLTGKLTIIAVA